MASRRSRVMLAVGAGLLGCAGSAGAQAARPLPAVAVQPSRLEARVGGGVRLSEPDLAQQLKRRSGLPERRRPLVLIDGHAATAAELECLCRHREGITYVKVLVAARAIPLYGTKGENGVVLVTTARGSRCG